MVAGTAHGMARQIVCCARGILHDFVSGNDATLRVCAGRVVFGSDSTLFNPWFTRGMVDGAAIDDAVTQDEA